MQQAEAGLRVAHIGFQGRQGLGHAVGAVFVGDAAHRKPLPARAASVERLEALGDQHRRGRKRRAHGIGQGAEGLGRAAHAVQQDEELAHVDARIGKKFDRTGRCHKPLRAGMGPQNRAPVAGL
ncbi:hypothetical protein D3C72_1499010 [compost metagenome]